MYLYEQSKARLDFQRACDDQKKGNMDQRKKGFNHLYRGIIHNHIGKGSKHKISPIWQIPWGKGRGNNP